MQSIIKKIATLWGDKAESGGPSGNDDHTQKSKKRKEKPHLIYGTADKVFSQQRKEVCFMSRERCRCSKIEQDVQNMVQNR